MKKVLTSAGALTFSIILFLALGMTAGCGSGSGSSGTADAEAAAGDQSTILDQLQRTDGAQVFVAAIQAVDESAPVVPSSASASLQASGCPVVFGELLNNIQANLVMLVPANEGFEVFLNLNPGTFRAWTAETIARMLPGLLKQKDLEILDLCDLLRRHISESESGLDPIALDELLARGSITMIDGSEYPVAIGGGRGGDVCVNYESCITQRDVFTQNGVIHYLHNVLQRAPVEEPPELPPLDDPPPSGVIDQWCSLGACAENQDMKDECKSFLVEDCLPEADKGGDREGCFAVALFKCTERDGLFGGDGLFDDDGIFD